MSKIISKPRTAALIAIIAVSLTACTDIILSDENGNAVGKLEVTANSPSPSHLTLNGKEFTGQWDVTKIYEEKVAKSRRLVSDRAYTEYMAGNYPDQLKHGHASFTGADESKVECDFYYRRRPHEASCQMDGKSLKLIMQQ